MKKESINTIWKLDHSLLVQQVERDNLRQQICAITLSEEEESGQNLDLLIDHWRRDLKVRQLKKSQAQLKARMQQAAAVQGDADLTPLQVQWQEINRQLEELSAL